MTRQQWKDREFRQAYYRKHKTKIKESANLRYQRIKQDGLGFCYLTSEESRAINKCAKKRGIGGGYFVFWPRDTMPEDFHKLAGIHKTKNRMVE